MPLLVSQSSRPSPWLLVGALVALSGAGWLLVQQILSDQLAALSSAPTQEASPIQRFVRSDISPPRQYSAQRYLARHLADAGVPSKVAARQIPEPSARQTPPNTATESPPAERRAFNESPSSGDLLLARRQVSIIVYGASWCPSCRKARAYLQSEGISFEERDVDHNHAASERLNTLNPKHTIPTFDIDGSTLTRWSPQILEDTINRAALVRWRRNQNL